MAYKCTVVLEQTNAPNNR